MSTNTFSPLDSHTLIKSIQSRPPLWNKNLFSHKEATVTEKLWNDVAAEVNSPKEVLKSRWKGLRDTFRKEFKKPGKSKWIHYKNLIFLEDMIELEKPVIPIRKSNRKRKCSTSGNNEDKAVEKEAVPVKEEEELSNNGSDNEDVIENESSNADINEFVEVETNVIVTPDIEEESDTSILEKILTSDKMPKKKAQNLTEIKSDFKALSDDNVKSNVDVDESGYVNQEIDDDYHFLMSLIPHVKLLPLDQKLVLRMKMQEIIYNEVFPPDDI